MCLCLVYIHVCNNCVFCVVIMYLDHLQLCLVCINGRRYAVVVNVMVSNECDKPTLCLVRAIGAHGGEVMYFVSFYFMDDMYCDYICMCVVNNQFELLEFVFYSVYAI